MEAHRRSGTRNWRSKCSENHMPEAKFSDNLLSMIAAELHFSNTLLAAREMYGRGYFSLGVGERQVIDQQVLQTIAANFQALTPDLAQRAQQPVGFRIGLDGKQYN